MKGIEAQDAWRNATCKTRGFRALRLTTSDKRPLADFEIDLPNGLVVVCGLNGVGKTTLLRLTHHALGGPATPLRAELCDRGTFNIVLELNGMECATPLSADSPVAVALLDAAEECAHLFGLARQPNFGDLAEGFDPREWSSEEIAEAAYVVGKDYTAIRVTECEDPGSAPYTVAETGYPADVEGGDVDSADDDVSDDAVIALIEVEVGELKYGFDGMGLGELSALILLWRLRRARSNTVVLLEEPETYLSARAAASLLDVLAKTVNSRRLYAVVTTHSPGLIRAAPLESIRVLAPGGSATVLRSPSSPAELENMLGLPSGPARVVLVEDSTAAGVVSELVARYAGPWAPNLAYLTTGGHERLRTLCEKFPATHSVHLVGVLDGDQATQPSGSVVWPVLVLPGPGNPDALLRRALVSDLAEFALCCQRRTDEVASAVQMHAGLDEHDWFRGVGLALSIEIQGLRRSAIGIWLQDPQNEAWARRLVKDLIDAVSSGALNQPGIVDVAREDD